MKKRPFATEAALCASFLAWVQDKHPDVRAFAEWEGWDILLVYPDGLQLGIQAKLRLNAEVLGQAYPYNPYSDTPGPDFRGVLVPDRGSITFSLLADNLGLVVFHHDSWGGGREPGEFFRPSLAPEGWWVDWNPAKRLELPPTATDAIAGSPCPVTLTSWKLAALDVLAELAVKGTITAKRMRELGVSPGRWTAYRWLEPGEIRGTWTRGEHCPRFDAQHPTAYALALAKATNPELVWPAPPINEEDHDGTS